MTPIVGNTEKVITDVFNHYLALIVAYVEEKYQRDFPLVPTISFAESRNNSWGGRHQYGKSKTWKPYISISTHDLRKLVEENILDTFEEYDSFKDDPIIGSIHDASWQKCLVAIMVHEVAHAIQFYFPSATVQNTLRLAEPKNTGHGHYFRAIYRDLRIKFVNGIDVDLPYEHTKDRTVLKVLSKKPTRKIEMVLAKGNNGWFIHHYYDTVNQILLGTMASKPKHISQGLVSGAWKTVTLPNGSYPRNHNQAKKAFLKI